MNQEEAKIYKTFQNYRPYIRSLLAFIVRLKPHYNLEDAYNVSDDIIRQLEKDLTE